VAPSLDTSAEVSVIAFAVAMPFLAALIMVNRQEAFRGRRTTSVTVKVAHAIAQLGAFVGIVAGPGLAFEDACEHDLKGDPDPFRVYRAVTSSPSSV
jgi:hypothetical protein